jgi:hypothetical protein
MNFNQVLVGIGSLTAAMGIAIAAEANNNQESMFQPLKQNYPDLIQSLQQRTELPLRLPSFLPTHGGWEPGESIPYFFNLAMSDPASYSFYLDLTNNCDGATACNKGEIRAKLVKPSTPSLEQNQWVETYQQGDLKTVELAQGIQGIFAPSVCQVYCSYARMIFDFDGVRYFVGFDVGKREQLEKTANSIITNPITQQDYE